MKLPPPEGAGNLTAVGPGEDAIAVFLVVLVLPDVLAAVGQRRGALAVLQALCPRAHIGAAVTPGAGPLAMLDVVLPLALVAATVAPGAQTLAVASVVQVVAYVPLAVWQRLAARAGLLAIYEHADVRRAILQHELALTVDGASKPLALVHAAVCMMEDAEPLGFVLDEGAYIFAAVRVNLDALAVPDEPSLSFHPLALVPGAVVKNLEAVLLPLGIGCGVQAQKVGRRGLARMGGMAAA
mmetsp:Transcript_51118/g.131835  ORF Transcript_51118/g.131835 Transcript_51118/m.131835 type:complete len:240 (-) Transcript_51118:120-839(-)